MKIYIFADPEAREAFQRRNKRIIEVVSAAGITVMSNIAHQQVADFSTQDLERLDQSGDVPVHLVDGVIIEGSQPLPEHGYLIASAIAAKKPVLYLVAEGRPFSKSLVQLRGNEIITQFLDLQHYTDATLAEIITQFINGLEQGERREVPSIKFTLRITPRIERYLQWKTHNTPLSKADYLRNVIEKLITDDEAYGKFIRRRPSDD